MNTKKQGETLAGFSLQKNQLYYEKWIISVQDSSGAGITAGIGCRDHDNKK